MKSRAPKKFLNFRIRNNLASWLKKHSEKTGKTKTRLVEEALQRKMEHELKDSQSTD